MNDTKNLKEEFGEYLKDHWEERETLPVADWWIEKLQEALAEDRAMLRGEARQTLKKKDSDIFERVLSSLDNETL